MLGICREREGKVVVFEESRKKERFLFVCSPRLQSGRKSGGPMSSGDPGLVL